MIHLHHPAKSFLQLSEGVLYLQCKLLNYWQVTVMYIIQKAHIHTIKSKRLPLLTGEVRGTFLLLFSDHFYQGKSITMIGFKLLAIFLCFMTRPQAQLFDVTISGNQ